MNSLLSPALVLASRSPRRRDLLAALGLPFVVHVAAVDEAQAEGESPQALVRRLSLAKAAAVAVAHAAGTIVIGADTVVVLDGEILGKPRDAEDALQTLRALRNRSHSVCSAVAVLEVASERQALAVCESQVWMRDYGEAEIDVYVAGGDPMDKAGSYAIQHQGFAPVMRIEGCYTSVMGLPLGHLARALADLGVVIPLDVAKACTGITGADCCLPLP
jgi:septum formation protein